MASILIIDDDKLTRLMLRSILEKAGYEVIEAPNGEVGLQLYTETPVDLIITDILMPGKDGIETIIDLKIDFTDIKIIAISSDKGWLESAKNLKIDKIISKPIDMNEILSAVKELL